MGAGDVFAFNSARSSKRSSAPEVSAFFSFGGGRTLSRPAKRDGITDSMSCVSTVGCDGCSALTSFVICCALHGLSLMVGDSHSRDLMLQPSAFGAATAC